MQISISISETAHWHALIGRAEYHQRYLLPQGIGDYLIRLFMRYEKQGKSTESVAKQSGETVSADHKLQNLADQCLLLCGFYPEASEEYGVAIQEFVSMGIEAYEKLAKSRHGEDAILFEYLAANFEQVTRLLIYIHDVSEPKSDSLDLLSADKHRELLPTTCKLPERYVFSSPITQRLLN